MSTRDPDAPPELASHTLPCFATPMVNHRWAESAELNASLAEWILALEQKDPGLQKSNVGGWHSALDLLEHSGHPMDEFRDRMERFSRALRKQFSRKSPNPDEPEPAPRLEAWANVLRQGQYNSVHNHPNALWSMVYYVTGNESVEEHPFSGKLELLDPRPAASLTYEEDSGLYGRLLINPQAGQLVAFPAWLQHQVHCYFGKTPRISIAINLLP